MSKYFMFTLDPIHIGTGGYQIGRVDNTIVREPATNLPKIPGSSIAGTARTYATYKEIEDQKEDQEYKVKITCAGQDNDVSPGNNKKGHCGKCIICRSFGFSKNDDRGSSQGLVYFSDAHILLFPVSTRIGPAWITSPMILEDFGIQLETKNKPSNSFIVVGSEFSGESSLNLGWLNLPIEDEKELPSFDHLASLGSKKNKLLSSRIVIVPDSLISQIINSNLEVRTSVSIDPVTGAGKDGALFTSEAIPRSTILWFELGINDPDYFGYGKKSENSSKEGKSNTLISLLDVKSIVKGGFCYFETLGIGGMVTRGFGRVTIEEVGENGSK
ncbi:type III-B CRISPR module RAMP protein Cmr4 [Methanosarcina siciliae]|nr:type III-B CRISPR module RAMP protein Cmr4 [Methanosarcina siciliae]